MIHVFYHGVDFDGYCSAALIGKYHNWDVAFHPMDHGYRFPWECIVKGDTVYVVDYVLAPFKDMFKLNDMCNLIWIDHHISAIKDYDRLRKEGAGRQIKGLYDSQLAGCELTWHHLEGMNGTHVPYVVHLLGRYDTWNHHDIKDCLEFQYGCQQIKDPHPTNKKLWIELLRCNKGDELVQQIINNGKVVLEFSQTRNAKLCEMYSFETEIDGHPAIALNKGISSSIAFNSVWDKEKYDFMISFVRSKGIWGVSLYTDKEGLDGSVIAKRYGGGGHAGACGFQCRELPFDY